MKRILIAVSVACVMAGCHTASPFWRGKPDMEAVPAAELRAVAQGIEQAVRAGKRDYTAADNGGVAVSDPEIQQAIRMRAARAELVDGLLSRGFAHEARNGLVQMAGNRQYKLATNYRQRERDVLIVTNENTNRWQIYEGIVKASKWRGGALAAVQEVFHEVRIPLLKDGQKYEAFNGKVVEKNAAPPAAPAESPSPEK